MVSRGRHRGARARHRAVRHRGARARRRRRSRTGGDLRGRRDRRDHDRGDALRPGRSAAAPRRRGRRAEPVDDDRHQLVTVGRARRIEGDGADDRAAARAGADRQRVASRRADRAPRHVGGAGTRRAPARRARRADATRGVRVDRGQAARRRRGRSTGRSTSRSSGSRSTPPTSTSACSPSCSRSARGGWSRW